MGKILLTTPKKKMLLKAVFSELIVIFVL